MDQQPPPGDDAVVERPVAAAPTPMGPGRMAAVGAVGVAMGMADTVPGFSGGTVALLAGVYERLVANVHQGAHALGMLARGALTESLRALAAIEWRFVLPLLGGIAGAIVTLASALSALLESHPRQLSAVFLGLVLGATVVASRDVRAPSVRHVVVAAAVTAVTFVALGLTEATVVDPGLPAFVAAGAVAVCAMILPGVSGAFLLLLLGMYDPAVTAVAERAWLPLGALLLGCVVGLAAFSTLLNWLLRRHHDVVLAALLGLLLGSSRVLWPWPGEQVGDPRLGAPVAEQVPPLAALAVAGFVAVWALGRVARRATRG